jgi:hypothetical protein
VRKREKMRTIAIMMRRGKMSRKLGCSALHIGRQQVLDL